jgi:hypothetical protein
MDAQTYNHLRRIVDQAWRNETRFAEKAIAQEVERMLAEYERQLNLPWATPEGR